MSKSENKEASKTNEQIVDATVILDEPIELSGSLHTQIIVKRPTPSTMLGTKITALSELEVNALLAVLPKVTSPVVSRRHLETMNPADFTELGVKLVNFLDKKKDSPTA